MRVKICNYNVFIELIKSIEYSLKELGVFDRFNGVTFVVKALRSIPIKGKSILLQTEQLLNKDAHHLSSGYYKVLDMFYKNSKYKRGTTNVVYCPVGYSPVWEYNLKPEKKDIDVLFYGGLSKRRKKFLNSISKKFKVYYTSSAFGLKRAKLINKSKVVLYLHPDKKRYHPPLHTLPAQANKAFNLVENSFEYGLFRPGINFHTFEDLDECMYMLEKWCSDNEMREDFAINAYIDLIKNCKYTDVISTIIGDIL